MHPPHLNDDQSLGWNMRAYTEVMNQKEDATLSLITAVLTVFGATLAFIFFHDQTARAVAIGIGIYSFFSITVQARKIYACRRQSRKYLQDHPELNQMVRGY